MPLMQQVTLDIVKRLISNALLVAHVEHGLSAVQSPIKIQKK
jgi:hypothetical protein